MRILGDIILGLSAVVVWVVGLALTITAAGAVAVAAQWAAAVHGDDLRVLFLLLAGIVFTLWVIGVAVRNSRCQS